MGRPAGYQWQPLGYDTDPVPGDPGQIRQEAQHLASVATQITNQVAVLRKIASDGTEVGKHADVIRSQASDLAGQLDKIVGRYQKVSSILNSWVPDLEQAQSMSIQALNQAEGPSQKLNQTVVLPSGNHLTAQQKQDVQNYHNAMKQAQGQLEDAKALLGKAIALRDSSGSHHADLINKACDDGMRDHHSFWGSVAGIFTSGWSWVTHHWSQIVADVCTVLEILATIAAIAAFIIAQFIPGLDLLVDFGLVDALVLGGMIATGAALGGRIALAATGHGSWLDVGIDAFALATFGVGRLAGAAGKALVPGIEAASKSALTSELLTDLATDGPRAAMLTRFAEQEGVSAVEMATRLGSHAPALANGAELAGFSKVMMNIGGFGEEGNVAAKLFSLGSRFTTPISDLSQYTTLAKTLTSVTGLSAGTAGVTGITATVMNGVEIDVGNWSGVLDIPALHNWYTTHLEVPTGAPAGG
jgi:hypothetical protein